MQMGEDLAQRFLVVFNAGGRQPFLAVVQQLHELSRQVANRQDDISDPGGDGVARHRLVFRLRRILDEDDAARLLDRLDANGAVHGRGQDDGVSESAVVLRGERAKKMIDRRPLGPGWSRVIAEIVWSATTSWLFGAMT